MAKAAAKGSENQFDERRETLVVERKTTWPPALDVDEELHERIESELHADPKSARILEYIRCPTGLIRHITVTPDDVSRLGKR